MVNIQGLGRLGVLAVGLGIGAAVAHSPVASADSSTDWLSSIDSAVSGAALEAPSTSGLNLAISFDGYSLVSDGNASASTVSGEYGLAIAYGDGAYAEAEGGTGDYALADGTNAGAVAGSIGGSGEDFDSAIDIGTNSSDQDYSLANDGSNDSAIHIGDDTGTNDIVYAGEGNNDSATEIGSNTGNYDYPYAGNGNDNTVVEDGNNTGNYFSNFAGDGNDNVAESVGNQSEADAGGVIAGSSSSDNVAYVLDPTGTDGSVAEAGSNGGTAGGYDLAAVLGVDNTSADAFDTQGLYDIVTALGNESGTAAATSGGLLGELLSLF
jgi:hypothetical protein